MVKGAIPRGIRAIPIDIEVGLGPGSGIKIVGLPRDTVREVDDRLRHALPAAGCRWPQQAVTINLAPAGSQKREAGLDLPLALSILEATEQIKSQLRDPVRDLSASVPDGILCRTSLACYKTLGYRSSDCRNFPQTSKYLFPPITYVSLWWAPRMT